MVVPFDEIFATVKAEADVGLIVHEGQLTENEGLVCCMNLGVWWGEKAASLPLGGNVIHKRIAGAERKVVSDHLTRVLVQSRPSA